AVRTRHQRTPARLARHLPNRPASPHPVIRQTRRRYSSNSHPSKPPHVAIEHAVRLQVSGRQVHHHHHTRSPKEHLHGQCLHHGARSAIHAVAKQHSARSANARREPDQR